MPRTSRETLCSILNLRSGPHPQRWALCLKGTRKESGGLSKGVARVGEQGYAPWSL